MYVEVYNSEYWSTLTQDRNARQLIITDTKHTWLPSASQQLTPAVLWITKIHVHILLPLWEVKSLPPPPNSKLIDFNKHSSDAYYVLCNPLLIQEGLAFMLKAGRERKWNFPFRGKKLLRELTVCFHYEEMGITLFLLIMNIVILLYFEKVTYIVFNTKSQTKTTSEKQIYHG